VKAANSLNESKKYITEINIIYLSANKKEHGLRRLFLREKMKRER
jgi:hypothetical protein